MNILKVVLDTNCLLQCVSRRSVNAVILDHLIAGRYELYLTNEILMEYEEKISEIFSVETAGLITGMLAVIDSVKKIDTYFQLNLITADQDDNKYVDCAFAANVHFIVTNDKHFNVLKEIKFPVITIMNLDEFRALLLD